MNHPIPVQCSKTSLKGQFCSRSKKIPNATVNVFPEKDQTFCCMLKRGDCQLYNTKSTLGQVVSFEEQTQSSNTEWKQLKIDYFSTCRSFESISVVSLPRFFRKRLS